MPIWACPCRMGARLDCSIAEPRPSDFPDIADPCARRGGAPRFCSAGKFGRPGLLQGFELALPSEPQGRLLDSASDDGAQSQWLRFDGPKQRRQGPASRLLLLLSE